VAASALLREHLVPGRRALTLTVVGASALAWAVLAGAGGAFDHHALGGHAPGGHHDHTEAGPLPAAVTVLLGWAVMVVAMMLPPALPMLDLLRALVARHRHPRLLLLAGVAGFVGVWTVVGTLLVAGDAGLHAVAERVGWLAAHPNVVAGGVLVGAGLYQFSPLKEACLRACRSPRGFAVAHWRGARSASAEAATVTGAYAVSCAGCCWALMAVSFAVGAAALPVMVVLAVLMAAERLVRRGRRLVRPVGVVAVALGIAVLLDLLPAGLPAA
jgi:predicted metal-binding membrane protein